MGMFDLDVHEADDGLGLARLTNAAAPPPQSPGFFAGSLSAAPLGLASVVTDVALPLADAAPTALRPAGEVIDKVFGTRSVDALNKLPDYALGASVWSTPDPSTTGTLGQILYGAANIIPEAIGGGAIAAASGPGAVGASVAAPSFLQAYKAERFAKAGVHGNKPVDDLTALGIGAITGASTAVGIATPLKLAPKMGVGANIGLSTGANVGTGMATRGATGALLEARGYPEMAAQYKMLDGQAMFVDAVMGAAFGAGGVYAHNRMNPAAKPAKGEPVPASPLPSDIDTALTLNNMLHHNVDTAPGLPADTPSMAAHVAAVDKALDDLHAGRDVNVSREVADANFIETPSAVAMREQVRAAVDEHMGDEWRGLMNQAERRGLPSDPEFYSDGRAGAPDTTMAADAKSADVISSDLASFKTARGSTYTLHEDGTTTRVKAARDDAGHEGDSGPKERSAKTYFAPVDAASALAIPQGGGWRIIDHGDSTLSLSTKGADGRWGIAPSAKNIKVSSEPTSGSIPIELWKSETVYNKPAYRGIHFGNEITEITPSAGKHSDAARPLNMAPIDNPEFTIPPPDGGRVTARAAIEGADAEIAAAKNDASGFEAAAECALRG